MYLDHKLLRSYSTTEQTSDALPELFETILQEFEPKRLFYARGPGSFMAIKISYIFLKTLCIARGITLFASDGFAFNNAAPIKAMQKLYFIKEHGEITTKIFKEAPEGEFILPEFLEIEKFSLNSEPLYILPAA